MTKMKLFMPLLVILIMGMATSAFAQLTCGVASTPVSRATLSGHTERAGDLIFTCTGGATNTSAATVTVDFGVPITNSTVVPTLATGIQVASVTGFTNGGPPAISSIPVGGSQIVLSIPAQTPPVASSFVLTNVLVTLQGSGKTSLSANVSVSPGNQVLITAGQNVATVITTILPGLAAPSITGAAALYQGPGTQVTPATNSFTVNVAENYIDSFRSQAQEIAGPLAGAINSVQVRWTFSNVPNTWGIGNCTPSMTGAVGVALNNANAGTNVGIAAGVPGTVNVDVNITGATNLAGLETLTLTCGTGTLANPALIVPAGSTTIATTPITVTVTLAPVGSAFGAGPSILTTANASFPRYESTPSAPLTVITFTPATTTFIIPYVTASGAAAPPAGTFDTGIAIANTTADPASFGAVPNGPARDQSGTITFTFFPADGSASFSVTTANVPLGGSLITNASSLLKAATPPVTGTFSGYVIGVANFTNAHGAAFVYGGTAVDRLTSATEVLVIAPPVVSPRTTFTFAGSAEATTK